MNRYPILLVIAALSTACATTGSAPIRAEKSTEALLSNLDAQLASVGFTTQLKGEALMADHEDTYKFIIRYDDTASRLIHYAFFGLKEGVTCENPALLTAIQASNRDFNLGKLYCDPSDETLGYEGVILLPRAGFTPYELRDYFIFLSDKLVIMSNRTGLFELLQ